MFNKKIFATFTGHSLIQTHTSSLDNNEKTKYLHRLFFFVGVVVVVVAAVGWYSINDGTTDKKRHDSKGLHGRLKKHN